VQYLDDNTYAQGQASGLVCQLASFSSSTSYKFGIIDWPATDRYNTVVLNSGVDTVVNERAALAYSDLGQAAQALGNGADATTYGRQATALRQAINTTLSDGNGLYGDGYAVSGSGQAVAGNCSATTGGSLITNASQTSQSFAVVDGVAPTSDDAKLGSFIASQGMKVGPMDIGQLELSLVDAGQPAALVKLLTDRAGDGPAKILAEGGTSLWESWDPGCSAPAGQAGDNDTYENEECSGSAISQTSSASFSHGWGSAALYPITRGLLGITSTGVAQSGVSIAPPLSGLTSARGTEWTQHGPVSVDWRHSRVAGGAVDLEVTVPDNVTATVALPAGYYRAIGAGAPRYEGIRNGRTVYSVGSGTTAFIAVRHGRTGGHQRSRGGRR
jgi:Bacterial alpha-L-rhamnosidase 6 hairpin glycosidase domain/Bacterial alpha-L-rhamnosidase C-terminal domain